MSDKPQQASSKRKPNCVTEVRVGNTILTVKGYFKQTSMSDYIIPTSMDHPKQGVYFVENPYEWGPFGAKGMGELVFNGSAAAYIDAVSRAIGKRIPSIPLPTEAVMGYLMHGTDIRENLEEVR